MYRLDRLRKEYKRFTAAQGYIVGFPMNEDLYFVKFKEIPRKYTSIQKECSKAGGGYGLYININSKKARNELLKKAVCIGKVADIESAEYNKGVMFEKLIYEHFGQEFRGKDSVPFHKAGDITIDGEEIQVKYLHARICYEKTLKKLAQGA